MAATTVISINICAITSAPKLDVLQTFLKSKKADVVFLQEVATPCFNFSGYQEIVNLGERRRGTAILLRTSLPLADALLLPCGRAVSVRVGPVTYLNVYAPSGARQTAARNALFQHGITPLLAAAGDQIVAGGDWNCVLADRDTTGSTPRSSDLAALMNTMSLKDAWPCLRAEPGHTFFAGGMSARLDRVYVSTCLLPELLAASTAAVACSADHLALTVTLRAQRGPQRGPSRARRRGNDQTSWTLDGRILADPDFTELLAEEWPAVRAEQHRYPSLAEWWVLHAKPRVRALAADFTREMRRELGEKLNFLQAALQELCAVAPRTAADTRTIRDVKKEIVELHAQKLQGVLDRAKLDSVIEDEPVSMHHIASMKRRAKQQAITTLQTAEGEVLTEHQDIAEHFLDVFRGKFKRAAGSGEGSHSLVDELEATISDEDNATLCQAITLEEVAIAIKKCPRHKSPGEDGLTGEFYRAMFQIIGPDLTAVLNEMWTTSSVPEAFMRGVIVLIPKVQGARVIKDFRPITLLNVDMKVYTRVQATRLNKLADKMLHKNQVRPGGRRTMAGALCDLRDAISAMEALKNPGCILSVDFSGAFDSVNHEFMFQILLRRGVGGRAVSALKAMYAVATSRIRVNGELTEAFGIDRSVRQGCPYSGLLFAVVLSPLLHHLERRLEGLRLAESCMKASAYADDAYFLVRSALEVGVCNGAFGKFSVESGLTVNPVKSGVLALGGWDQGADIGYPYVERLKVLGISFTSSIKKTVSINWPAVVNTVKGVLCANTARMLGLTQRADFVRMFALSKLWHVAQVLPIPAPKAENIIKAVHMFLFKGQLFKVKGNLCCQPQSVGGLGIPDPLLKSNALFTGRWQSLLFVDPDSFSAEWLQLLLRRFGTGNPPNIGAVWPAASHFTRLATVRAYCAAPRLAAKPKAAIRELYRVQVEAAAREVHRVEAAHPAASWPQVWANLCSPVLPVEVRDGWFIAAHDLVATNLRLHELRDEQRRHPTGVCARCGAADTLLHRLSVCGGSEAVWRWLRRWLAKLTGSAPEPGWLLRPEFSAPTAARQAVALWLAGHWVAYLLGGGAANLSEVIAHLRAEKDKVLRTSRRWPEALTQALRQVL